MALYAPAGIITSRNIHRNALHIIQLRVPNDRTDLIEPIAHANSIRLYATDNVEYGFQTRSGILTAANGTTKDIRLRCSTPFLDTISLLGTTTLSFAILRSTTTENDIEFFHSEIDPLKLKGPAPEPIDPLPFLPPQERSDADTHSQLSEIKSALQAIATQIAASSADTTAALKNVTDVMAQMKSQLEQQAAVLQDLTSKAKQPALPPVPPTTPLAPPKQAPGAPSRPEPPRPAPTPPHACLYPHRNLTAYLMSPKYTICDPEPAFIAERQIVNQFDQEQKPKLSRSHLQPALNNLGMQLMRYLIQESTQDHSLLAGMPPNAANAQYLSRYIDSPAPNLTETLPLDECRDQVTRTKFLIARLFLCHPRQQRDLIVRPTSHVCTVFVRCPFNDINSGLTVLPANENAYRNFFALYSAEDVYSHFT